MKAIMGNHGDINRVDYGMSLWSHVIRPSLEYAGEILTLSTTDLENLEKMQRAVGKYILKACRHTANEAVLGDLGWTTIKSKLDTMKLKYYQRICKMNRSRWTKVVFEMIDSLNEINGQSKSTWIKSIDEISTEVNIEKQKFVNLTSREVRNVVEKYDETKWQENMTKKSSLTHYLKFKSKRKHCENYLLSLSDFRGAQLKFKARSYTLGLAYEKRKWSNSDGDSTCPCCHKVDETLQHFMLECESFAMQRKIMMEGIVDILTNNDERNLKSSVRG